MGWKRERGHLQHYFCSVGPGVCVVWLIVVFGSVAYLDDCCVRKCCVRECYNGEHFLPLKHGRLSNNKFCWGWVGIAGSARWAVASSLLSLGAARGVRCGTVLHREHCVGSVVLCRGSVFANISKVAFEKRAVCPLGYL